MPEKPFRGAFGRKEAVTFTDKYNPFDYICDFV